MTVTPGRDDGHEIELKLRIPADAAARVLRHPAVVALKRGRARTATLISVYFDTPDHRLAQAGVSVRLRNDGRGWLQTVKGPATDESGGGLNKRVEREWRVARSSRRPPLDLGKLADLPYGREIGSAARHGPLTPIFTTRIERTSVPLRFADLTDAQLCIDHGQVHAGSRLGRDVAREAMTEVEIELESGDPARLFDLALALAQDLPVHVQTRSKAQRGFDLIGNARPAARRADPIELAGDSTAADAMAGVIRNGLRQLEENADAAASDDDPESIHQMRVAVRRLRSALALLESVLQGAEAVQALRVELKEIAALLGRVRDLDVFALDTLTALGSASERLGAMDEAAQEEIALLAARAGAQAADARHAVRAAIASPRFTRLLLGLARLSSVPQLGTRPGTPDVALMQDSASRLASRLLGKRHRKVHASAEGLGGSPEARHRVRIQAKKLRYATEFFASLFPGRRARTYRKALTDLQEVLGIANDAATAITLAAELAPGSRAASLVRGWATAQLEAQAGRTEGAWRDFVSAKRFWTKAAR